MRGAWASLDDGLVLNDDDATAAHFPEANILRVEAAPKGSAAAAAAQLDPNRKWYPPRSIATLLTALGVPPLSARVTRRLHTYGARFASKLDAVVREQVPRLQRWLLRHAPGGSGEDDEGDEGAADGGGAIPSYPEIRAAVLQQLPQFGVRVADEVFELLQLGAEMTGRIKVAAAMEGASLYVSADRAEDYEAVYTELSR